MMKKVLSALTALAFTGAYAATLTIGGQVQSGIKITGGNHKKDTTVSYYLDTGDTKIFLKYKDAAKGIEGVVIGDFDGGLAASKESTSFSDIKTADGVFNVNQAWIKFDLFKAGDVSAYMKLGLQPNVIKVYDISITDVWGPGTTYNIYNATNLSQVLATGYRYTDYTLVKKAVTMGVTLGGPKIQVTLVDPAGNKGLYSLAEVATIAPTKYADVAVALDMNPGQLGNNKDDKWLLYGYVGIKAIDPVDIKAQVSYGKYTDVDNTTVTEVAVKVASKKAYKLISKPAKPYIQIEYLNADKNVKQVLVNDPTNYEADDEYKLTVDGVAPGIYYLDRQFAVKVGTIVQFNKHLTENGYIKYIAEKYADIDNKLPAFEKTSLEIGGEFTLKFAKSINLE